MADALVTKSLAKTLDPFNVIFAMLDTITKEEKGMHRTVSIERVTLLLTTGEVTTEPTERAICRMQVTAGAKGERTGTISE